jgi:hypothetical protein
MTNAEIVNIFTNLTDPKNKLTELTGAKFSYALIRNSSILRPAVVAYEEARKVLLESFSKKDKEKKPVLETVKVGEVEQQQYVLEDQVKFQKEFQALLQEEVNVNLFQISLDEVPTEITGSQMMLIYPIIKDDNPVVQPIKKVKK